MILLIPSEQMSASWFVFNSLSVKVSYPYQVIILYKVFLLF